ncbi:pre-mRNA-processing protein 40C-like isoform X2 [Helianthus annuus]|uniref:pre-mRNA-processing protein 40C-like isoform X2 n=1 Tax=Helianthus annuus TaxID=4232 RepID=UPI000B9004F9|nr:pre-mRNA-processing protein 40C-like isoform X2 [Helianthus annuus]
MNLRASGIIVTWIKPDKVFAQSTPLSWEKCAGTDWSLVTTNDGKRYYYNAKTKLSNWQIPADVAKLRKTQENDALKEQSISMHNVTTLTEKGSGPLSLNAPAITTCGCDAISPVSPSTLDLIKKKLQDSAAPATIGSDLNGRKWKNACFMPIDAGAELNNVFYHFVKGFVSVLHRLLLTCQVLKKLEMDKE